MKIRSTSVVAMAVVLAPFTCGFSITNCVTGAYKNFQQAGNNECQNWLTDNRVAYDSNLCLKLTVSPGYRLQGQAHTSQAVATPTDKGYAVRRTDEIPPEMRGNIGKMEVTGPIFEGGPDVTLYGTAQEVYEQILALNPHAFDNITDEDPTATTPAPTHGVLERRAKTISGKGHWVYCRNIANDIQDIYNKCGEWAPDDWGGPSVIGEMRVGNTHATNFATTDFSTDY
ncbi:hypothetical protein HJFPF1_13432 [Paramyrothecium foliicola]|nr:hypothetical protein HJFPF1_13432 [Paramyrothecium foliicola]